MLFRGAVRRVTAQMAESKKKILVLTGPTAVGKTKVSLLLAKELNGEIISADSIQVYRGLNIGSDKISPAEREGIPHHMIDTLDPHEDFSAGDFFERARAAADDILARGKVPIVVGGTGFYLNFFIRGKPETPTSTPETERRARAHLQGVWHRLEAERGAPLENAERWAAGTEEVRKLGDPATADRLNRPEFRNNTMRLVRAVEILLEGGGRPLLDFIRVPPAPGPVRGGEEEGEGEGRKRRRGEEGEAEPGPSSSAHAPGAAPRFKDLIYSRDANLDYDFRCFYLIRDRVELYRRIDKRVEEMVAGGLLGECEWLLNLGLAGGGNCATAGIGYRQGMAFLAKARETSGKNLTPKDLKALVNDIQAKTRTLTRRQGTWFRGDPLFRWIGVGPDDSVPPEPPASNLSDNSDAGGAAAAPEFVGSRSAAEILASFRAADPPPGGNFAAYELSDGERKTMKRYISEWHVLSDARKVEEALEYARGTLVTSGAEAAEEKAAV